MGRSEVRKCFELRGHSLDDLERRLDTLRQAVRAQNGAIVDVRRFSDPRGGGHAAAVVYEIPLAMMTA